MRLILLFCFLPIISYSQQVEPTKDVQEFYDFCLKETEKVVPFEYQPEDYFYTVTDSGERKYIQNDLSGIKVLFYWSTSCHYCKKELKELKLILKDNPEWKEQMMIAVRADFKWEHASIVKEGEEYVLYKKSKEYIRTTIPVVLISEEFGEKNNFIGNPHTFFYNKPGQIALYKGAYLATKEKLDTPMNQQFLDYMFNRMLD